MLGRSDKVLAWLDTELLLEYVFAACLDQVSMSITSVNTSQ